jgi:hypothetical protein
MWTTPIPVAEYLPAPLLSPNISPPRKPGLYAAGLRRWVGEPKPHEGIMYVGITTKGEPSLLFRVSLLVLESIGFTGENLIPVKPKRARWVSYYHTGGAKIWRYCTDPQFPKRKPNDPFVQRDPHHEVFISWRPEDSGFCAACEEGRLYGLLKGEPQFLNDIKPPPCGRHP